MKNYKIKTGLTLILIILNLLQYAQNQKKIDSLFSVIKTAEQDTSLVNAYSGLCQEYHRSNPDTALYFGNTGLKFALKINFKKGIAKCYNNIGLIYSDMGAYDKALECLLKTLKIVEELNNKNGISACCNNIGLIYEDQELYDIAIKYYLKSLRIAEESEDKKGISVCYLKIGTT